MILAAKINKLSGKWPVIPLVGRNEQPEPVKLSGVERHRVNAVTNESLPHNEAYIDLKKTRAIRINVLALTSCDIAVVGSRSMSTSPDPNNGVGVQSMNAGDQTSRQGEIVAPGRKRIQRACDKCSNSRTKCDGKHPWSAISIMSSIAGD